MSLDPEEVRKRVRASLAAQKEETQRQLGVAQDVASGYQPDQYAEATKLGQQFGVPPKTVADNPDPYRKESLRRSVQESLRDTPATRQWMTNVDNAAVAQDEVDKLAQVERTVSKLTRVADVARSLPSGLYKSFGMSISGIGRLYGVGERAFTNTVDAGLRFLGADDAADFLTAPIEVPDFVRPEKLLVGFGSDVERDAEYMGAPVERQNIATDIAGGLGQIAGQIAVALTGGTIPSTLSLLGQGADIQGDRAEAAGASQADADRAVVLGSLVTAVTERYQLDRLLKVAPPNVRRSVLDRLTDIAAAGGSEALQEVVEGIGQNLTAKALYEPDAAIFEGLEREAIAAGGAGAIAKAIIDAIVPGRARQGGERTGEIAGELSTILSDAQLALRSPEQLESLASAIKERAGVEYAYVDPAAFRTLFQSDDEANAAANEMSGGQNTYFEAAISNTPIALPIEKYIARVAPKVGEAKVQGKPFTDFVAFDPEGLTANEANAERENIDAQAKEIAEREISTGRADSSDAIYDDVRTQLIATGMEPSTAERNATLMQSVFRTLGRRAGVDALSLYRRYGLRIRSQFEGDAQSGTELTQEPGLTEDAAGQPSQPGGDTSGYTPTAGEVQARAGLVQSILAGGVTYQPTTAHMPEAFKPGAYSVSPYPERGVILAPEQVSGAAIDDFIAANADLFSETDRYFGAWFDQETNKVFFDVSIVVPTREQAIETGLKHRQIAYFDFETMQSVDIDPALRQEYVPDAARQPDQTARAVGDDAGQGGRDAGGGDQNLRGDPRAGDVAAGTGRADRASQGEGPGRVGSGDVAQTDTPEFRRWFGDSKVVDASGKPKVVFHGTNRDFDVFNITAGPRSQMVGDWTGVHFTSDQQQALDIAKSLARQEGGAPRVVAAYLRADNPAPFGKYRTKEEAQAAGHDSRLTENNTGLQEWTVFDPAQIKSATGNRGTFDPDSDNILYQSESEPALPFYSALTRAAEGAKINKADAAQWMATLRNTQGVKPEELQWSGIEEWLGALGRPATKAEVIEYLKANQIVIEEIESGGMATSDRMELADRIEQFPSWFEGAVRENDHHYNSGEPDVTEMRFTFDGYTSDEDGQTSDLPLKVHVQELSPSSRSGNWAGSSGGKVYARVRFPDGRQVDAAARFKFEDDEYGQPTDIGELDITPTNTWDTADEFTDSELNQVALAMAEIKLEPSRELDTAAEEAIRTFESEMTRAAESLREGDIDDARKYLEYASSTARNYGENEQVDELLEELNSSQTKYDSYVTAGNADNYREVLLTLPDTETASTRAARAAVEQRLQPIDEEMTQLARERYDLREQSREDLSPEIDARLGAIETRMQELAEQKRAARAPVQKAPPFKSSHFDESNIVAHMRFNERTDADGKRVLFIEEIQSDWHQAGRKRGYKTPKPAYQPVDKLPAGWSVDLEDGSGYNNGTLVLRENGEWRGSRSAPMRVVSDAQYEVAIQARAVEMYNDRQQAAAMDDDRAVPDAPFKTTWAELAFKRMIRYAADEGFDRIAWTPGKVQNERYDLSKQVDDIHVHRQLDGTFTWSARKDDQERDLASGKAKNVDDLADSIGKELADKANEMVPGERETYRGDDLKVGGSGMIGFYDKILPATVNKLVKKWNAKVGSTKITTEKQEGFKVTWERDTGEEMSKEFATKSEAQAFARTMRDMAPAVRAVLISENQGAAQLSVQSLDITPEMKAAALGGLPMFQGPSVTAGKRGSITFGTDRKFTINLFEKRDLSTFLHESGHLYLEILGDLASQPDAPAQVREDFAKLLKWFGVKNRDGIGIDQHEQFARGFEAYLAEGKAPSTELEPIFFRFRQWLMAVYQTIRRLGSTPGSIGQALNVSLTDEVRGVMDRMVATDEEIASAERQQQYAPIFTDAEAAGMSQAEWSAYRDIVDRAHRESVDELTGRAMAELAREKKAWWKEERAKLETQVTEEVNTSPLYRAISFLTKGKNPDGSALAEGVPAFKLSRADVVARFGQDAYRRLPRGSTTTAAQGISADTAAQMLGFPSGADMVRALIAAPARKEAIKRITDARMRERHGDMMIDGSMVEQAIDSVHTEARAKVLAAELKALNAKRREVKAAVAGARAADKQAARQSREANAGTLPTQDELRVIKLAAQRAIAAKKIRTITPQLYRNAERKAARVAFEMAGKGKFEEAYLAKRQQILNYELYRAAVDARAKVDKHLTYMRRFDKKSVREKLAAAKGQYLAQIDALRARFDFTPQPADADLKRAALAKWVDEQVAAGREVAIPQWVIDEARTTPYKELLAAELDGLVDAAKNIEHLALTKDRLMRNRKEAQFKQAKAELEARARASLKGGKAPPVSQFEESRFQEFGRFARETADAWLRPETIIEWLDGGETGPWHDFLWEPANNAEYGRETLRTKILEPMRKLANGIDRKRRAELFEDIRIESLRQSFDRRTLISIALNMGNDSNLERLLEGGFRDKTRGNRITKFTPQSLDEIKGKLNATDWKFIQEAWNTAESLWPELKAFQERMGGLVPEKIPATPIETRFGKFTGGYWPVVYDSLASTAGAKQADSAEALGVLMGANFTGASTSKSALQARTGTGGPLKLDFSQVMGRHLDQVITDITHREFAIQAMRILDDPDLRLTIQDSMGQVAWHSLKGMVRSSIQQDGGMAELATAGIDTIRRRLLSNLAVAALGFKLTTAFGNLILAPVQGMARVSKRYMLSGFASFMANPVEARAFVDANSEMMRNRAQNIDAGFNVIREKLEGRTSLLVQTQRAAMAIHRAADYIGTTGIWLGRYREALNDGSSHAEAARLADKAIRTTQTAGAPKDLSAFERNPAYAELKLFIGPMIIMGNRIREAASKKGAVKSWPEAFGVMMATWFLPAILWDLVNGRGPDDDDDDGELVTDEFLNWSFRKLLFYPFMTVPYLRDAFSLAERKLVNTSAEARMTPAADATWLLYKAGDTITTQMLSEEDADMAKILKDTARPVGAVFGLPTGQLDITGSYIWDVYSGEYEPQGVADWRYLVMRRPKED